MYQEIAEKALEIFPSLNTKNVESEIQKQRWLRSFFYTFLAEFNVDTDSVARIQLCQNVSGDDDMIPLINLMCCFNKLTPGPETGLFDLLSPSTAFLWKRIDIWLKYYEFSDNISTCMYNECNPYINSKKIINDYVDGTAELNVASSDELVKINHENKLREETEVALQKSEELHKSIIDEKRAAEQKIQEAAVKRNMLMRKKQQTEANLNDLKYGMEMRTNKLDQTLDCDDQLKKLNGDLSEFQLKKEKMSSLIENERMSHQQITKLKNVLTCRVSSVQEILIAFSKLKQLNELLQEKQLANVDNSAIEELAGIQDEISQLQKSNNKISIQNITETEKLKNAIDNRTSENVDKQSIFAELKSQFKDVQMIKTNIEDLNFKEKKIIKSLVKEEKRLKQMERQLVARRKGELDVCNVNSLFMLEAVLKSSKNLSQICDSL